MLPSCEKLLNIPRNKQQILKLFVSLSSLLALAAFLNLKVFAQETTPFSITASPVFFEFNLKPGESQDQTIKIRNNGSNQATLSISTNKLESTGLSGDIRIADLSDEDKNANWFQFEQNTVSIAPGEWKEVPFSLTIPQNAAFGNYFTITFTQAGNEESVSQPGAQLSGAVAIPILINVDAPGSKAEAKLIEFKTANEINEHLPVEFLTTIENTGNIHLRPIGNVFVKGNNNKDIASIPVNDGAGNILPGSARQFSSFWTDGFIVKEPVVENDQVVLDDNGNPKTKVKINWNKLTDLRFGKYTAVLLAVYDDGQRDIPMEATTTFWVIPYKLIAGAIVALIIGIVMLRYVLRAYVQKEVKKQKGK